MRASLLVNHYYFYCVDKDFGPFFVKFCSYFPYNGKCCLKGNEGAKRQAEAAGIAFEPLDNGFLSCEDPKGLNRLCGRLGPAKIDALVRKWLQILPHPFTAADRLPLRHLHPAGRVLPDPDPRPAPVGAGLLRGGDP